jgi:hypothetical protein
MQTLPQTLAGSTEFTMLKVSRRSAHSILSLISMASEITIEDETIPTPLATRPTPSPESPTPACRKGKSSAKPSPASARYLQHKSSKPPLSQSPGPSSSRPSQPPQQRLTYSPSHSQQHSRYVPILASPVRGNPPPSTPRDVPATLPQYDSPPPSPVPDTPPLSPVYEDPPESPVYEDPPESPVRTDPRDFLICEDLPDTFKHHTYLVKLEHVPLNTVAKIRLDDETGPQDRWYSVLKGWEVESSITGKVAHSSTFSARLSHTFRGDVSHSINKISGNTQNKAKNRQAACTFFARALYEGRVTISFLLTL